MTMPFRVKQSRLAACAAIVLATLAIRLEAAQGRNFRAEQTSQETRRLALGANGRLELRNVSGDITVVGGGGTTATVDIIRTSRGRTDADARRGLERVTAMVTEGGSRALVEAQYPAEQAWSYAVEVAYRVTAPAGTSVTISSVAADVRVSGIEGGVAVEVSAGDVTLSRVGRVSTAKTVSGDLRLTDVSSDVAVEAGSMNGDVIVRGLAAPRVDITTVNGDVSVTGLNSPAMAMKSMTGDMTFGGLVGPKGRYEFQTHSGTVRLDLGGASGYRLEASTYSGEIRPQPGAELTIVNRTQRVLRATSGEGGATIVTTTFSGDVIITRR